MKINSGDPDVRYMALSDFFQQVPNVSMDQPLQNKVGQVLVSSISDANAEIQNLLIKKYVPHPL